MASAYPPMSHGSAGEPYDLYYDRAHHMIVMRTLRNITDRDAPRLGRDLEPLTAEVRSDRGCLRMMFDLRGTALILGASAAQMTETLYRERAQGDRIAVLVNSSVVKAEARPSLDNQTEVFLSETAAMTWLNAWVDAGSAAGGHFVAK